jgi:hypothetical protein
LAINYPFRSEAEVIKSFQKVDESAENIYHAPVPVRG